MFFHAQATASLLSMSAVMPDMQSEHVAVSLAPVLAQQQSCMQGEAEDSLISDAVEGMLRTLVNTGLQAVQDEKVVEHAFFTQLMQLIKV